MYYSLQMSIKLIVRDGIDIDRISHINLNEAIGRGEMLLFC